MHSITASRWSGRARNGARSAALTRMGDVEDSARSNGARGNLVKLVARPGSGLNAQAGGDLGGLGQQPGLADSGRSLHDRDTAGAVGRRGNQPAKHGALAVPAAQRAHRLIIAARSMIGKAPSAATGAAARAVA